MGYCVPKSYVIKTNAYFSHIKNLGLTNSDVSFHKAQSIESDILGLDLNDDFLDELKNIFEDITLNNTNSVALRSSSPAEDRDKVSSAGIYLSILNISKFDQLILDIKKCWASYWSIEAVNYRNKNNISHWENGMALILQNMVDAKYSGVLFTSSPMKKHEDKIHIEYIAGLGEGLVEGKEISKRILVDRLSENNILDDVNIDPSLLNNLNELIDTSIKISKKEKKDLDFEWSIDSNDKLWFLQCRPITIKDKNKLLYGYEPIVYNETLSPFGKDLAEKRYVYWVKANKSFYLTYFEDNLKEIDSIMYCKTEWKTPRFFKKKWMDFIKIIRLLNYKSILLKYDKYLTSIKNKINFYNEEILPKDKHKLFNKLKSFIELYNDYQYESIPVLKISTIQASILKKLCTICYGEKIGYEHFSKIISSGTSISSKRNRELNSLIFDLNQQFRIKHKFKNFDEFISAVNSNSIMDEWNYRFSSFLEEYGYIWANIYPRDPIWELNGKAILKSLFSNINNYNSIPINKIEETKPENMNLILGLILKPVINLFENLVIKNFHHKEDRNHYVYKNVSLIKNILIELGILFYKNKSLHHERDIFYLKINEINNMIYKSENNYNKIAKERRNKYYYYNNIENEKIIINHKSSQNTFKGECCVEGIVKGRINKIHKIGDLDKLEPGDILLCKNIRPAWSYIFTTVSGVVIESGGHLSHGATLLREHKTPSIINVENIFNLIPQHSKVIMNCEKGLIEVQ